jgi:hypothetical protein
MLSVLLLLTVISVIVVNVTQATFPPNPDRAKVQAQFCEGPYVLCIRAPCVPIPIFERANNFGMNQMLCTCEVIKTGMSMGPLSCAERQPVTVGQNTYMVSTYSNLYNRQEKTMTCLGEKLPWGWCYGAPCVIDARNPNKAVCTCPIDYSSYNTLSGDCQQQNCDYLWSAATIPGDFFANKYFYETVKNMTGQAIPPAKRCPAPTSKPTKKVG